jgi:hypothetical protein
MPENTKLAAAIVAAQKEARAVGKDGKNQHHGYRYATAEAIIDEGRAALNASGLSLLATSWSTVVVRWAQIVPDNDDHPVAVDGDVPHVEVHYLLLHESGESMALLATTPAIEGKGRPIDKAACAALTTNLAYVLRGLLLLPRDDDAAAIDARDDRGHNPADRAPAAPARTVVAEAGPRDAQVEDAEAFMAVIEDCVKRGALDELEAVPAKVKAAKLRPELYRQIVDLYNPAVADVKRRRAEPPRAA